MDATHRFRYFIENAVARAFFAFVALLPEALGRVAGEGLGRLLGAALSSRSGRAAENLRAAFPEASDAAIQGWIRGMWRNLGRAAWEFSLIPSLTREQYFRNVEVEGLEGARASLAKGRGIIFYGAHLTNWEWTTLFLGFSGFPLAAVARRMKNPFFDAFITDVRTRHGVTMFQHRSAVREGMRWIRQGKCLGILIDQRITAGGVQVPFFGRPAYTTTMAALLALRTGAALHGISAHRSGDKILVRVHPAFDVTPFNDDPVAVTAAQTAQIESWIREDPSMWLWMHNRWKQ
jgi:KDO2-lipid IV(A) lauroyltransferase